AGAGPPLGPGPHPTTRQARWRMGRPRRPRRLPPSSPGSAARAVAAAAGPAVAARPGARPAAAAAPDPRHDGRVAGLDDAARLVLDGELRAGTVAVEALGQRVAREGHARVDAAILRIAHGASGEREAPARGRVHEASVA